MPTRRTTPLTLAALVTLLGLLLTACGSGDSTTDTASEPGATASSAPPSGGPGRPGGFDQEQLDGIQQCLEAAGLADSFPTDLPTDLPSDLPSGGPSQGDPGGGLGAFNDPDVQAALEACGIELPTPRPSPQPSS